MKKVIFFRSYIALTSTALAVACDFSESCSVRGSPGFCTSVAEGCCMGTSTPGYCSGSSDNQCCTGVTCTTPSGSGTCVQTALCTDGTPEPGYCPGPSGVQCCVHQDTTPSPSLLLPPNPNWSNCLEDAVFVPSVSICVDAFESAIVVNGTLWNYTLAVDHLLQGQYVAIPANGIKPQAYISGDQAQHACNAAGKRLCSAAEWLAACQGPDNFTYPYGNTYEEGFCNEGRETNPVNDVYGPDASFDSIEMNDPQLDQLPSTVSEGGKFENCLGALGTYDMHGNVHEWVEDISSTSGNGEFHGGYFVDASINGPGCTYVTTAHAFTYHDYSTGFRCCSDPEK